MCLDALAENPDLAELFAAYPELTAEDVKACLRYAQMALRQVSQSQNLPFCMSFEMIRLCS
jgi:uncharacterized protein (DUF433 family)